MDEHAMTQGVIPVRHSSLPGVVKLPRRYEKAALGDPRTAKHRKVSICGGPLQMRETISDRLDDLMTAIMWVKQELILLRQHDILLKRQFFDIHDSIQSLQPKQHADSLSPTSTTITMNGDISDHPSSPSTISDSPPCYSLPTSPARIRAASALKLPSSYSDYRLETFLVRPSASVTLLNSKDDDSDEDSEDGDTFDETYYRPRTSSMRTSRDLAALARRRGSKELI